jgi:hypothetical protein
MTKTTEQHFRSVVPMYMRLLMTDFPQLTVEDAAAVFGNAGHESKGLTDDQEDKPTVAGSRGGLNWMQWTGPRRRQMEAYCARNRLDPNSDIAAYKWLFIELNGTEKKAIPALLRAKTLETKVVAFEKAFLRAGVKHYPSREHWARVALDAYGAADDGALELPAEAGPAVESHEESLKPTAPTSRPGWMGLVLIGVLAAIVAAWVFLGGQAVPVEDAPSLFDAPVPRDRPFGLARGSTNLFADIGLQIASAFLAPLASAAATAVAGWIIWQWNRVLKADFDAKSAASLHAALERGMLAAIEAFGPRSNKAQLVSTAVDYAEKFNGGTIRRLGIGRESLEQLALPHLATAKKKVAGG